MTMTTTMNIAGDANKNSKATANTETMPGNLKPATRTQTAKAPTITKTTINAKLAAPSTKKTTSAHAKEEIKSATTMSSNMLTTLATTTAATLPTITTITSDPGILCFHHCNVKVFCFSLPDICPNCKSKLYSASNSDDDGDDNDNGDEEACNDVDDCSAQDSNEEDHCAGNGFLTKDPDNCSKGSTNALNAFDNGSDMHKLSSVAKSSAGQDEDDASFIRKQQKQQKQQHRLKLNSRKILLPFRLPYPFVRAAQSPCAIVLRPTIGDFLNDYNNAMDLHIAVTTSTGSVVEFDRHGLRQQRAENMPEWWQCLLVGDVPEPWYDYWDEVLKKICREPKRWSLADYHEDTHNCYTFVLAFLQALNYEKLSAAAANKTTFCEQYIVPKTTAAGKYISLYRRLRHNDGIYVHKPNDVASPKYRQNAKQMHVRGSKRISSTTTTRTLGSNAREAKTTRPTMTMNGQNSMASLSKNFNTKALKNFSGGIIQRLPALCTIEE